MSEESKKQAKARQVREVREWLRERFPEVFNKRNVPLAIGIHSPINEAAKAEHGPSSWAIQAALHSWTDQPKYLKALMERHPRHHLDGTEADAVTEKQAEQARQRLAEIERKRQRTREQEQQRKAKLAEANQGQEASPDNKQPRDPRSQGEREASQGQQPWGKKEHKPIDDRSTSRGSGGRPIITLKNRRRRADESATEGGKEQ